MDKDLLRIVIIAIGAVVIFGMVLWSFLKNRNKRRAINFVDKGNPLENIDKSLILNTDNDDFDIVPLGNAVDNDFEPDPITIASEVDVDSEPLVQVQTEPEIKPVETTKTQQPQLKKKNLPSIIQFSLVAVADEGFNGIELAEKFTQVGFEYGSMKIFERLDDKRRVDYAVASMVEPGTFPDKNLESFNSPGIVFFIQPSELDTPLETFDDFVQTINWLANELDGVMLDHNRQNLTKETIQDFRNQLAG